MRPVMPEARSGPIEIDGERYSPHSGLVYGRSEGIDGYMLADAELPPGELVAIHVSPALPAFSNLPDNCRTIG